MNACTMHTDDAFTQTQINACTYIQAFERGKVHVKNITHTYIHTYVPVSKSAAAKEQKERRLGVPPSSSSRCGILGRSAEFSSSMATD